MRLGLVLVASMLLTGCVSRGPTPIYLDMEPSVVAAACRHATGNPKAWGCSNPTTGVILCPADDRNEACRAHEARHLANPGWRHADDEPVVTPASVHQWMGYPR